MTSSKAIPTALLDELLKDYKSPQDLLGEGGLLKELTKRLAERALEAEMEYRQRVFAAAGEGVDNLDAYLATNPSEPMPRLLLVIDEFAMLAKDYPDVLKSLVSVGAVGRTLGVHMILATQRPAGVVNDDILGSMEFGCAIAGAKLIVIMGHTQCGAVTAAVKFNESQQSVEEATGCQHLQAVVNEIRLAIDQKQYQKLNQRTEPERVAFVNDVARRNVQKTIARILQESRTIHRLVDEGTIGLVGAMYDVVTGSIEFFPGETIQAADRS